jgi:uncharacterized pyridoxal phosphate-dependent enzyme
MERRDILKSLAIIPFAGAFKPLESLVSMQTGPLKAGQNIYQSIGVEPVINCRGTFTIIGGSIERPGVIEAAHAASQFFVQYDELAFGVGQRLAELTGADWGIVTAGCAAALKLVTAACVTGGNPEKLIRIPDLSTIERNEVVFPRSSRVVYDHAVRNIGVKIITVDTLEDLGRALGPRTAMIFLMAGRDTAQGGAFSTESVSALARQYNVPVLVDAAAEDLSVPNVHLQAGASVVAYSGGKALCGPQCAGLALGRKDILMSAWQASSPHHGPCRDNKVGKEEIIGMLAAVEDWVIRDHVEKERIWMEQLDHIAKRLATIKGITTSISEPSGLNNRSAYLTITWNPGNFNITGQDIIEILATTKPRIAIGGGDNEQDGTSSLRISSNQLQPGNEKIVAERLRELLSKKYPPKPEGMNAPGGDLNGRWTVTVEYFSSTARHSFIIEQDGNWIQGLHKTDYSLREMVGTIEGDQVKLSSSERMIANNIPYIFSGTLSGGKIEGEIYMGEYLRAKFVAARDIRKNPGRIIRYPDYQPLSS